MKLKNLKKAEEIRVQIEELEQFIDWKPTIFEKMLLVKGKSNKNKFSLIIEKYIFLKAQLVELGVEVE